MRFQRFFEKLSRMKIRKKWFSATALVANQCFADLGIWYKKIFLSKVFSSSIARAKARGQMPGNSRGKFPEGGNARGFTVLFSSNSLTF